MKKTIPVLLTTLLVLVGCQDKNDTVAHGLYIRTETIGTFGGDSPLVSGTVSGYSGLSRIDFSVSGWGWSYSIDLSGQSPKVFNYSIRMDVPSDASFPETLSVKVSDEHGNVTEKTASITFLPDTAIPAPDAAVSEDVEVLYEGTCGVWKANYSFTDDRALVQIRLVIPFLGVDDKVECSGKTGTISGVYTFGQVGNYSASLTATDAAGNIYSKELTLVVMPQEDEDPVEDYPQMYLFDADENAEDYLSGYYHYMNREAACCYKVNFYASHDDFHLFFAPKASMDGDIFGASPYIASKLMNKKGYVVPITIEKKGYYGIYIDLMNHSFSLWDYDVTSAYEGAPYTGELQASGTGFSVGDWGLSDPMTRLDGHDYIFTVQMTTVGYSSARDYYFANCTLWDPIFRCDNAGQSWFVYASGPCCEFTSDYEGIVDMYIDTALPWGWIKKAE